jgi:hypothetical protein
MIGVVFMNCSVLNAVGLSFISVLCHPVINKICSFL